MTHIDAVLGRGSWNAVKQQSKRADTVEKTAAKELEANVFTGTYFAAELINRSCFKVCSEAHNVPRVKHCAQRACGKAEWPSVCNHICLTNQPSFKIRGSLTKILWNDTCRQKKMNFNQRENKSSKSTTNL